jgi:hypothetical protein
MLRKAELAVGRPRLVIDVKVKGQGRDGLGSLDFFFPLEIISLESMKVVPINL